MSRFDRPQRRLAVALVCVVTVVAFEAMSVATIMPVVEDDLDGLSLYGWVFAGFFLAQLVGIVAAGRWCDRRRPLEPMVAGLGLFTLGLAVGGAAPTMLGLVGGRPLVHQLYVFHRAGESWSAERAGQRRHGRD